MTRTTAAMWAQQNLHDGDRLRLFRAVAAEVAASSVLYPGSFVDVAPSFAFDSVTYVDTDNRANSFFADSEGVRAIVSENGGSDEADISFIHADYTTDLALVEESFDLLVSLYAGFVSESCTRYLRIGGCLLVNPSHGDAALASIDSRHELSGAVILRDGNYRIDRSALERYLVPKKPQDVTRESLHASGRGVAYTVGAFAYLFTRIA